LNFEVVGYLLRFYPIISVLMSSSTESLSTDCHGAYAVVVCVECRRFTTQHRCLAKVQHGGVLVGRERVCGAAICAICSDGFGNEGIIRCKIHANNDAEPSDEDVQDVGATSMPPPGRKKNKSKGHKASGDAAAAKVIRAPEYTAKDLLVLAQAYIRTSENAIDGTAQKRSTFWDDVAKAYHEIKVAQQDFDKRQKKRASLLLLYALLLH
jgi:hypothetical protein